MKDTSKLCIGDKVWVALATGVYEDTVLCCEYDDHISTETCLVPVKYVFRRECDALKIGIALAEAEAEDGAKKRNFFRAKAKLMRERLETKRRK